MRNIKLTIEYDGTDFLGFQSQARGRTVQGELESALQKLFQKKIRVIGSSRTDSGVHAEAQVVNFKVESEIPASKMRPALNRYLPKDIAVVKSEHVQPDFHAQRAAKWKRYEYRIWNGPARSPLRRRDFYFYPVRGFDKTTSNGVCFRELDIQLMRRAARKLVGRRDFRMFESSGSRRKGAVREVRRLSVQKKGREILIGIEANGFLYRMARSIAGTLVAIGTGKLRPEEFDRFIAGRGRPDCIFVAPAHGLVLKKIIF